METVRGGRVQLLEIERELTGADWQEALARHDAILHRLAERLEAALNVGVAPDEFPKLMELKDANIIARKILRLTANAGD